MGYLAKDLIEQGHKVFVISTCLWGCSNDYSIPGLNVRAENVDAETKKINAINPLYRLLLRIRFRCGEEQALAEKMIQSATKILQENHIDLIISSSAYSLFPHEVAARLTHLENVKWIADLRDIHEQYAPESCRSIKSLYKHLWKKWQIKKRNQLLEKCHACVTVSKKHQNIISQYISKVYTVYNGYDDFLFKPSEHFLQQSVEIVYGGRVYRDETFQLVTPFFEALCILKETSPLITNLKVVFYTGPTSSDYLMGFVNRYHLHQIVEIRDNIPYVQFAEIAAKAKALVVFSSPFTQGVITTKLFEYIGCRRPVMVISDGDGEISEIIGELNCGVSLNNSGEIVDYLSNLLSQQSTYSSNDKKSHERIKNYTRRCQNQKFISIIEQICLL
jgi:glycosyltransferase involved in cell wall biosynthesis